MIKPDLFGQSTGLLGSKLFGIVEIPDLIEYLTTNKSDLKAGPGAHGKRLNQLLDPVREELKKFLVQHGVAVAAPQRNPLSSRLERELSKMLKRLPELQDFEGSLRKSRNLRKSNDGDALTSDVKQQDVDKKTNIHSRKNNGDGGGGGISRQADQDGKTRARRQRSRRNQGPRVAFEEHPGRSETAWLDSGDTIVINTGLAAFRSRTANVQAELTYCMFAIGVALDKADIDQPGDGASYVDKFIAAWGQS